MHGRDQVRRIRLAERTQRNPCRATRTSMSRLARIAISIGDPAGIGAEIALKALQDQSVASLAQWILVADPAALNAARRVTGIDPASLPCALVDTGALAADHVIEFGQLRAAYGLAAIAYVRRDVDLRM